MPSSAEAMQPFGNFQKSGTPIKVSNSRALITRTPTKTTPNLEKQPFQQPFEVALQASASSVGTQQVIEANEGMKETKEPSKLTAPTCGWRERPFPKHGGRGS